MKRIIKFSEMQKLLIYKGFILVRTKGDHYIYKKNGVEKHVTINKNLNPCVALRLVKEFELLR